MCFQATQEIFVAITGNPSDEDIVCIRKIPTPILLSIPYDEVDGDNTLCGLVASQADYKSCYHDLAFTAPMDLPIYPAVLSVTTAPVHDEAELKKSARLVDFNVHAAAMRGCHDFIRTVIKDT